jgi:hypothetical protein
LFLDELVVLLALASDHLGVLVFLKYVAVPHCPCLEVGFGASLEVSEFKQLQLIGFSLSLSFQNSLDLLALLQHGLSLLKLQLSVDSLACVLLLPHAESRDPPLHQVDLRFLSEQVGRGMPGSFLLLGLH